MAERGRMKILHVLTDRNIGGAGRWLLYYLKYYDRAHFAVKVVLPEDSLLCERVAQLGVPVIAMQEMEDLSFDKKALKPLIRLLKKERPDIIHTHASLTARVAARRAKVPVIFHTKHCMEGAAGALPKRVLRRRLNRRYSHRIIAVSKAVRHSMIAGGTDPKQIVTVYNGIEKIPPLSAEEKQRILAEFGGKSGEKAVGMVARLEEVKDHETLLLGAKEVLSKRQDVRFYIIGDGSLKQHLEERAKALGIAANVSFTGFIRDVEKIEAALDIAVITSRAEALCLSILESMIAGVPAVGTDSGGVSEVISHGENGYLVPVGDAHALANRLLDLLENDEKRRQMGEAAAKMAEREFLAEQMTKKIEKLYLEAKR